MENPFVSLDIENFYLDYYINGISKEVLENIKVKIQEVEVPYPYIIDKQNSEKVVDLKVGCTTSVEFKNDKIEEKEKIELPKTGFQTCGIIW